jgi:hypothetical protein
MHIYNKQNKCTFTSKTNAHLHRQKTTITLTLTHIPNPYPYPNLYFNPKQPYPDLNPDSN